MPRPRTLNNSGGFASNGISTSTGISTARPADEKQFGGTTFVLGGTASTKLMALDDAANFRRRGFNVNTVPITPFSNRRTGAIDTFGVYVSTPEGVGGTALAQGAKKQGRIASLVARSLAARISKRREEKKSESLPKSASRARVKTAAVREILFGKGVARIDVKAEAKRAASFGKGVLSRAEAKRAAGQARRELAQAEERARARKREAAQARPQAKRTFGGKVFTVGRMHSSRGRAQDAADRLRKRGFQVRVVPINFERGGKRLTHVIYRAGKAKR